MAEIQTTRVTAQGYAGSFLINEGDFDPKVHKRINIEGQRIHASGVVMTKQEIEAAEKEFYLAEKREKDALSEAEREHLRLRQVLVDELNAKRTDADKKQKLVEKSSAADRAEFEADARKAENASALAELALEEFDQAAKK